MGQRDDGLGLSLGLGLGMGRSYPAYPSINQDSLQLNLMPMASESCMQNPNLIRNDNLKQKCFWNGIIHSSDRSHDTRSFLGGLDVNRVSSLVDCDEDNGVSSPNSTVSSISGKRSEREPVFEEIEAERTSCSRGGDNGSDDEDINGDASRKKLRLSKEQSSILEETFKEHNTLNPKQKLALAKQLNLRPRQVEVWFQNRRARTKLKQTEVDCEYLKRCCENLTEENRRLQKEVQELRALKLSPQLYMHMNPPTTLTMCPSCERVTHSTSSSSSSAAITSSALAALNIPTRAHQPQRSLGSPWAAMPIHNHPRQMFESPISRS